MRAPCHQDYSCELPGFETNSKTRKLARERRLRTEWAPVAEVRISSTFDTLYHLV
jgi:hypothetical protein